MAQNVIYPGDGSVCAWEKGEIHHFGIHFNFQFCAELLKAFWKREELENTFSLYIFKNPYDKICLSLD